MNWRDGQAVPLLAILIVTAWSAPCVSQSSILDRDVRSELSDYTVPVYDDGDGIVVIPPDLQEQQDYSLSINGRFQTRYSLFDDGGPYDNPSLNEFEMERVRLGFRGFVYDRFLTYNIGTNWDADSGNTGRLTNAFVQWRLDEALGIGFGDRLSLRAGFWRTNFGRQRAESSKRLQFVGRSVTSSAFRLGTNAGVALIGRFTHNFNPVNYELALLNGFGAGGNSPRSGLDNNIGIAFRINESVGGYESGEPDLNLTSVPMARMGMSAAYTHRTRRGPTGSADEFDATPAVLFTTDATNASFPIDKLHGSERSYDLWLMGFEGDLKHCGWSLHSEYLFRWISNITFQSPDTFRDFSHGFYVQGGYFLTEKVEVVARHSALYANGQGSGSPTGMDYSNSAHATGGGLNFYFRGHNSKLQIDAFYYDGAPFSSSSLNLIAGDQGTMIRTQYQLAF